MTRRFHDHPDEERDDDLHEPEGRFGSDGEPDQWSPALVGRALVWALRIARFAVGPTGPRGPRTVWPVGGLNADDVIDMVPEQQASRTATTDDIDRMERALMWQARYIVPDAASVADAQEVIEVFKTWLSCRVNRRPFVRACDRKGWVRATAYRRRDRALSKIAQGLDRDGEPVWRA